MAKEKRTLTWNERELAGWKKYFRVRRISGESVKTTRKRAWEKFLTLQEEREKRPGLV